MVTSLLLALALLTPQDKDVAQAVQQFKEEMKKPGATVDDKVAAVKNVAKCVHECVVEALTPYLTDGPVQVRIVVARELGRFIGCANAVKSLNDACSAKSNGEAGMRGVRITILRSLGDLKAVKAIDLINGLLCDLDEFVAKAAVDAAGKIRQKSSVEPLLKAYEQLEGKEGDQPIGPDPLKGTITSDSTMLGDLANNPKTDKPKKDTLPPTTGTGGTPSVGPGSLRDDVQGLRPTEAPKTAPKNEKAPETRRELLLPAVSAALTSITKQNFKTFKAWSDWWTRNRTHFKVPD